MPLILIYWTHVCSEYLFVRSLLKKCGDIWKNCSFFGCLLLDWGGNAQAAMARLWSIALRTKYLSDFC